MVMNAQPVNAAGFMLGGFPPVQPPSVGLPPLREELRISAAGHHVDGSPAWVIQDPVRNRFFRIGWLHFEMLLNWGLGDVDRLVDAFQQTTLRPSRDEVLDFIRFLSDNELIRLDAASDVDRVHARQARMRQSGWKWLLHHYLFFRVPLVRPQQWLAQTAPYLNWIQTRDMAVVVALLTLLGLYFVSRQWDTFTHTITDQMTFSGLVGYAVALVFVKTLHELGHAYRATRLGVRVAHMGVAFLVMFPMLYTDTGESWRLKNPRHRLSIASAGMVVELALAGVATLGWALMPDGALRNGLFFLATTSWVLTLAINASPFMRFDGYFILSDVLDMPNLHERSSAMARVWLRRFLLGWNQKWPEDFSVPMRRALIAFAITTWVYRLVVFLGIALLVYFFFFKLLGIFLMLVELVWFIAKPVWSEIKVWRQGVARIKASRFWLLGALLSFLVLLLFLPLNTRIHGHGWLRSAEQQALFSPFAAQLTELPVKSAFRKGEKVLVLDSKELSIEQERARQLAGAREQQMNELLGQPSGQQRRAVLESEKRLFEAQAVASQEQQGRLVLLASFDGVLQDLDPEVEVGSWVRPQQPLAWLVNPKQWLVEAYLAETDLDRVQIGQRVRMRQLVDPPQWLEGRVKRIDFTRTTVLPTPMLDVRHGGPMAVVPSSDPSMTAPVLRDALYRVQIELPEQPEEKRLSLVRVQIDGAAESLAGRLVRSAASIIVRESGF
jgi:putative peptide zinc metalloprotease protein